MPTSLVSTGVQFPDNSIQTTAAAAGGLTLISTTTASSSSSVVFSGLSPTAYHYYQIVGKNMVPSGVVSFQIQVSTNNGSSFITTNYYAYSGGFGTPAYEGGRTLDGAGIPLAGIYNSDYRGNAIINLFPNSAGGLFNMTSLNFGTGNYFNTIPGGISGGTNTNSTTAVNAVRLLPNTGTFSGIFKLYGVAA